MEWKMIKDKRNESVIQILRSSVYEELITVSQNYSFNPLAKTGKACWSRVTSSQVQFPPQSLSNLPANQVRRRTSKLLSSFSPSTLSRRLKTHPGQQTQDGKPHSLILRCIHHYSVWLYSKVCVCCFEGTSVLRRCNTGVMKYRERVKRRLGYTLS